ncbi:hypothetical protein [Phenylobacterium sp.]|jgi:cytochrome c5|uniref:hypothetical protein n=1 Tax=Phenylobacterium sp. TaxID=1871053 RepID=UPI002F3F4C6F
MRPRLVLTVGMAAALAATIAVAAQAPQGQPPQPQSQGQPPSQPQSPPQAAQPPLDPVAILNGACTMCHGVDFIAEHRKDHDDWDFTVHRMMDKGADLQPDEATALIDYLAKTYPKPAAPTPPPPAR